MQLFRPVGLKELELIAASAWRAFPPRLPEQPIFYPVLNREYAVQIARDWNTKDRFSGWAGFVTVFEVDDAFAARYPVQIAGSRHVHQELWVPAEELDEFNRHILAPITVLDSFYGPEWQGLLDPATNLPAHLAPAE